MTKTYKVTFEMIKEADVVVEGLGENELKDAIYLWQANRTVTIPGHGLRRGKAIKRIHYEEIKPKKAKRKEK